MERTEWSTYLQNFIENRTIAVNKDQEDDDAIELINCVYKFTMCRLQDTIRDPGFRPLKTKKENCYNKIDAVEENTRTSSLHKHEERTKDKEKTRTVGLTLPH